MPSSTLIRTVSTASRLHVSSPTKGLRLARFPRIPSSPRSFQRFNHTAEHPRAGLLRWLLRIGRPVSFLFLTFCSFAVGTSFTLTNPLQKMLDEMPTDEETLTAFTPSDELSQEVEEHIRNHALSVSLREDPDYVESRPYLKIPENVRAQSLTAGTLSNSRGIVVPPLVFSNKSTNTFVSILYLGNNVSGHPGIVHGGFLATLLDEGMGRCAFNVLPNKVGVTANLNVDYRRPAMANSYFVMRAQVVKSEGRKAWVEARIETLPEEGQEPDVLVEAKSLFVEPKLPTRMTKHLHKFAN